MNKSNWTKRKQAGKLARDAGLIDKWGRETDEYKKLILQVTGKDRISIMTPENCDRFLEALEGLAKNRQNKVSHWLNDPWSRIWMWILVFVLITGFFFLIDQIDGSMRITQHVGYVKIEDIAWAPWATAFLVFNMAFAALLRPHIKRHGRNSIAWTTAVIVFTPILAGIGYLLTWPFPVKR